MHVLLSKSENLRKKPKLAKKRTTGGERTKLKNQLLKLKNDIVFQEVFGKQKNSEITKHLISLILQREIENIELDTNRIMIGNHKDSKVTILDIKAKFNNGEDCNIELQVAPYQYMPERMLIYWSRMYGDKAQRSKEYDILKPTISILIADYKIKELKEIEEYHTIWNLREKKHKEKILTRYIVLHGLEIPKIKEEEILKDELALWLKFIDNPENKEVNKKMGEKRLSQIVREELAELSDDPDFEDIVWQRTLAIMDEKGFKRQAREEGLAEGAEAKKIEIAQKLLKLEMPIKQIAEITELTEEEVQNIKADK